MVVAKIHGMKLEENFRSTSVGKMQVVSGFEPDYYRVVSHSPREHAGLVILRSRVSSCLNWYV